MNNMNELVASKNLKGFGRLYKKHPICVENQSRLYIVLHWFVEFTQYKFCVSDRIKINTTVKKKEMPL